MRQIQLGLSGLNFRFFKQDGRTHCFVKRVFTLTLSGLICFGGTLFSPLKAEPVDDSNGKSKAILATLQEAFSAVADELEPAVVTVFSSKTTKSSTGDEEEADAPKSVFPFNRAPRRAIGTGSGVIIRKDGWILTNDHVVSGADRVTVKLHDGREFVGTVRRDFLSDLALVKVETPVPLPVARLGDSDKLKIGHWAVAIGSPYRYEGSFSVGVVSSLFRQHTIRENERSAKVRIYPSMIQTDAAINPGNSGGPLCNLDGEVIGVNTAIESEGGGSIGIGFAIPINSAKFVVEQLMLYGKVRYGKLGVNPRDVTPQQAKALGVSEGAWIDLEPKRGSAGEKAGLKIGDVITSINGKTVRNELDLRMIVLHTLPDSLVDIAYVRSGKKSTLRAKIDSAEPLEVESSKTPPKSSGKPKLGIDIAALTDKLAGINGLGAGVSGVYVKMIDSSSSASEVDDLVEGSVILQINDTLTPTPLAFRNAISNFKSGDQVKIIFLPPTTSPAKTMRILQID